VATIRKVDGKLGTVYQAIIRKKGQRPLCRTFMRKSDAKKWAVKKEADLQSNNAGMVVEGHRKTLSDAIKRYKAEILPDKSKGTRNAYTGQLDYWESALGSMKLTEVVY